MGFEQQVHLNFPINLAKVYERARLETVPQLTCDRLVTLFEESVRHLALTGLALHDQHGVQDEGVAKVRKEMGRPSLGNWVTLFRQVTDALHKAKVAFPVQPMNQTHSNDPMAEITTAMATMLGISNIPKKARHVHFLETMTIFRNKKFSHGTLSSAEARKLEKSLTAALDQWLESMPILQEWHVVYVKTVAYQPPGYRYSGTKLNSGSTLYRFESESTGTLEPRRVYLLQPQENKYTPLHPYFAFSDDTEQLYLYGELSNRGQPVLLCPYDSSGATNTLEITEEGQAILKTPTVPTPQPEPAAKPKTTRRKKKVSGTPNWFDIIQPHEDIRKGNFDEAVFAADLGDVAAGIAPPDYNDPYIFFKKTYLTEGLKGLLLKVHKKLTTGDGPSVIQIQTPFGGGKTHSLVALYHYLEHGEKVKSLLPKELNELQPKMAVTAGNHFNPLEGQTSDGVTRYTFWGELAYLLGGAEGYKQMQANDEARISPGKDALRDFLAQYQPFILLYDEILEYINRAMDVRARGDLDVALGTQTLSFFQELSEAVSSLDTGMLVVTLPLSKLEDFGERQEETLARLGKIFGRVESIETPVRGEEIYAVIRRRLFEVESLKQAPMREIVHRYGQLYQEYRDDMPPKAREVTYREKMEDAYPFHPDVIDILYEKWSTFSSFQRTRGVLRLLANVVEDLYQRETNIDLILPGDLNLENPGIRQDFLKHIGPEYEGVIASDIAGAEAKAQALDRANRGWKHLAQRIATSIFFHSFTADDSEKGINLPYIRLAVLRSDAMPALVTEVLLKEGNVLWYLNSRGETYYFSKIPNLNRMILDKKELYNESYEEELEVLVKRESGREFNAYVWPANGDGIADNRELKLVILHPEDQGADIPAWTERKGKSFREYKNTLFFVTADTAAFASLREDLKTYLALQEIEDEILSDQKSPLAGKSREINDRKLKLSRDFSYNVRRMYHRIRSGERDYDLGQPVAGQESLGHWFWRELTDKEVIVERLHYRMLVNRLMAGNDQVATGVILDQFYKNTDLPAPADSNVVARAIQLGVQDGAFGLAMTEDGEIKPELIRFKESVPLDVISFEPGFYLISKEVAETMQVTEEDEDNYRHILLKQFMPGRDQVSTKTLLDWFGNGPGLNQSLDIDALTEAIREAVKNGELGFAQAQKGQIGKNQVAFKQELSPDKISFSDDSYLLSSSKSQEILQADPGDGGGTIVIPPGEKTRYHHVRLVVSDVPANRIADVNRGIFLPLSASVDGLTFKLEIDVNSEDGISPDTLEHKIKETIRQIGASIEEETVE